MLGTFGVLAILGFSINTMTLFGLVLAVGLLVDDAIVVVENIERILDEQPELTVREATIQSMDQIQMALIAIAMVLSAVFLPMIFFGGSIGCHLPPVLSDDRVGDGPVGVHRPDAQPRRSPRQYFGAPTERSTRAGSVERCPWSHTRSNARASSSTTASNA